MTLPCQVHEFSLPDGARYLNCAYMSPLPRRVEAAGVDGIRRKRFPVEITPADFFTETDRARARFAELIGADPSRIAVVPAVSYAIAAAARNLRLPPGSNVVMLHEQFPSNVLIWRRLAAEQLLELRVVHPPAGVEARAAGWNERVLDAIDARTSVVAMEGVHWTDGTRFDLERIGARAREVGAAVVLDLTQSAGAEPVDVARLRPDLLVAATYKWLFGPMGIGFAYFGPRFDGGTPIEEAWLSRGGSEDFRRLADYRDDYRPGAVRYDVSGRGNFILPPMASAALELILGWQPAGIAAYCAALLQPLTDAARDLGFAVEPEAHRAAHILGLRFPTGHAPDTLQAALARRRISVSLRGSALRVAPNVYNTPDDIGALIEALREAM
jgi:selenocysteine lyase/cysteine desulfurase